MELTRREFLKISLPLSLPLFVGLAGGIGAISRPVNLFELPPGPTAPGVIEIRDPMNPQANEPLDLFMAQRELDPVLSELTQGYNGLVRYRDFLRTMADSSTILVGEPHVNDSDKIALREMIAYTRKTRPAKNIVVALGRFTPADNQALDQFIHANPNLSEFDALGQLANSSSYNNNWAGMDLLGTTTAKEYANLLVLLKRNKIKTVALGVDIANKEAQRDTNGIVTTTGQTYQEIATLESTAADIIQRLELENPGAIVIAYAGRPHVERGASGEGITPKLEDLHANQNSSRQVVSVQTFDPIFDQALDSLKFVFGEGPLSGRVYDPTKHSAYRNSVLVVNNPKFANYHYENKSSAKKVWTMPGSNYLLARFVGNG